MNIPSWVPQSVFYHIYPLGMFGAPKENNFSAPVENRLDRLYSWLDHLQWLGINAVYFGPVFESGTHGYDTTDYFKIDRRLGDEPSFTILLNEIHQRGIRIILDGVFNHVGRSHFAFRDVQMKGQDSQYVSWFSGLDFNQQSPYGDSFTYETWDGHFSLPKLDLHQPAVRDYLLSAVRYWLKTWHIDGLRLDAADCLDMGFIKELNRVTKTINPEFWLMGEVVHGDYSHWAKKDHLDSVTNYEGYKGLYSSLNDANYFEISYALNRQFGTGGVYRNLNLYNFVDNHDVNRVASQLNNQNHLYPLYGLLFTMPGIPSLYYGSEWGIPGKRTPYHDDNLRPALDLNTLIQTAPMGDLPNVIKKLAAIRKLYPALYLGDYQEVFVQHQVFIFKREFQSQTVIVMLNASNQDGSLPNEVNFQGQKFRDVLNDQTFFEADLKNLVIPPYWMRILVSE